MQGTALSCEYVLQNARKIIETVDYCFMMTHGEFGQINARLVQHLKPEQDLIVWLGTSNKSRKIDDIHRNNKITLAFQDNEKQAYITIFGTGFINTDIETRQKYWHEDWLPLFPNGPETEDYVLVKFIPSHLEIMDLSLGILSQYPVISALKINKLESGWRLAGGNGLGVRSNKLGVIS